VQKLFALGLLVVLAGFVLILLGAGAQGGASAGGVIFIGPFPIVFGSGPSGLPLALISIVIGAVMVALFLLWGIQFARMKKG
jgi:uncharacterized membrane protein